MWLYFKRDHADLLRADTSTAWAFAYGHYVVFASAAAIGASLAAIVDVVQHEAHVGHREAGLSRAVAVSLCVLALWASMRTASADQPR